MAAPSRRGLAGEDQAGHGRLRVFGVVGLLDLGFRGARGSGALLERAGLQGQQPLARRRRGVCGGLLCNSSYKFILQVVKIKKTGILTRKNNENIYDFS